jgi:serine/threonine protein kinase/tetratricopeptide (TPR) repeat protein
MKCPSCDFENPDNTRFCGNCASPLQQPPDSSPSDIPRGGTVTFPSYVADLAPGRTFGGRYQIIEEIGAGGMGRVFKATDLKVNEIIALKLIHPEIAFKKKNIDRFRNELRLTRKIAHRNVCRMFHLHEDDNATYITMEYVQGEDLKNSLRMMGPFTIGKAVSIATQVCEGLKEAHNLGIFHRDLKAKNIILDRDGNTHIMDFGIASSSETKGLTEDGISIGTPTYMSPEQAAGKDIDHRSDIYSLGVIVYEMATGEVPFKGDSSLSIAMQHKMDPPKPPIELNRRVPEPLNRLILKCLEKKKENRYQSVDEILADLKAIDEELTTGERHIPLRKMRSTTIMTSIKSFKVPAYVIVGAILLLALAYFIGQGLTSSDRPVRIAVLPFEYLGPDPSEAQRHIWGYLANRIGVKLRERFQDLIITPDRSAEHFATTTMSNPEIGQALDVDYLLDGKIRIEQDDVDMSVALIDAREDASVANITSNCSIGEIFDNEVIKIADQVGRELGATSSSTSLSPMQPDSEAMLYLARGRDAERMYRETEDAQYLQVAEKYYLAAVEIQPDYSLHAWHLGSLYELLYIFRGEKADQDRMFHHLRRAYELDNNSAETNLGMGWVAFYERDNDAAYQYFLKAYELDPNNFDVNYHVAGFLRSVGLFEKAIKYYDIALILNPGELTLLPESSAFEMRISCLLYLGRIQQAFDDLDAAGDRLPDSIRIRFLKARLLIAGRMYEEAEQELTEIQRLDDSNPRIPFYRSMIHADLGEREKALEPLQGGAPSQATYFVTQIYCALGMNEEALQSINEGIETGMDTIQTYLYTYQYLINHPNHDLLRQEPEYQEIVRIQKQIYDHMVQNYWGL